MGNKAVITTEKKEIGIYLHWNGHKEKIEDYLATCKKLGHRPPEEDNYGWARLCQVIGNDMKGSLSVGIDKLENLDCDNKNNGMYIIKNWKIIKREYYTE